MRYTSCAEWPPEVFTDQAGEHVSTDLHHTREEAQGVCDLLSRYGFGGWGKKPIRVWVKEVEA